MGIIGRSLLSKAGHYHYGTKINKRFCRDKNIVHIGNTIEMYHRGDIISEGNGFVKSSLGIIMLLVEAGYI